jgi:G6PDH family F420-dependent oxidoreductase
MIEIGYALSCEEHPPRDLVSNARRAEQAGFPFALISDHFHPWLDRQGQSAFVWSVIGGIAQATSDLELGTGVTCPTVRIHPAVIAQAAATSAALMPGRFFLGVGTGENLNEHILGYRWPPFDLRAPMLEEAVEIIRLLWEGDTVTYYGDFYDVEEARLYTLPETSPPLYMAAGGEQAAGLAGKISDGLIATAPEETLVQSFQEGGGGQKPTIGQLACCYAESEEEALETAYRYWPNAALPGELSQELRTPAHFEQAVQIVTKEDLRALFVLGSDPADYLESIQAYREAGFNRIYLHQIGPEQVSFFSFFEDTLRGELE